MVMLFFYQNQNTAYADIGTALGKAGKSIVKTGKIIGKGVKGAFSSGTKIAHNVVNFSKYSKKIIAKQMNNLRKKSDQKHRKELKDSMGKKKGKKGNNVCKGGQAHHIFPMNLLLGEGSELSKCGPLSDPKSPQYINNAKNGICLPKTGHHGSHGTYDKVVKNVLSGIPKKASQKTRCEMIDKAQKCIRNKLRRDVLIKGNKINSISSLSCSL